MGGPIDMNIGVFWETSMGFAIFQKYSQSYVHLNVKSRLK